jgi:hypothetical protein
MSFKRKTLAAGIALALAAPLCAQAADSAELAQIREQIKQMKESYESRIQSLEARLQQAESTAGNALDKAGKAEEKAVQAATAPQSMPPAGTNAFNPGVSLILSGLYSNLSKDPANYRIGGFMPSGSEIGPGQRGFSLSESELGIYANIDHYFYGGLNFSIHPDNTVSAEEAFIQTSSLPQGLTLKGGRFFSGIGYLNEQHAHTWDFVDAPLAYQAFLGGQVNNDGVQLRWIAPTETFLEIGAELGRGANFPGSNRDKNGAGASAIFAHFGGDVGDNHSWRAGLSMLRTSPQNRAYDDIDNMGNSVTNNFSGDSRLGIADLVWKWSPNGNAYNTSFKLQGEYLHRTEDGNLTYAAATANHADRYASSQSGWYLQGIYQWSPSWRVGVRRDQLDGGSIDYASNNAALVQTAFNPSKNSLMFDYNPSEFSRIRLQFAQDNSRQGVTDNQLFLQYQMSLGAHGAHKF